MPEERLSDDVYCVSSRGGILFGVDIIDLEFSAHAMRDMADQVVARCVEHITTLPNQSLYGVHDAEALCERMRESSPAAGTPLPALLDDLFSTYIPQSFNTPAPGYLAYIPGGGLFPAALADFIADTTNRYTGIWQAAPALVQTLAHLNMRARPERSMSAQSALAHILDGFKSR